MKDNDSAANDPAHFYTGLVAELYEPLAGGISDSARFIDFVKSYGEPALEICCGSGLPLLDLVESGLDVEGLDSSEDMLDLCRTAAKKRGIRVKLHRQKMQEVALSRQFQSIYIANGSITLLTSDEELRLTLEALNRCLKPGGTVSFDLDQPDIENLNRYIDRFKEKEHNGATLRVGMTSVSLNDDGRNVSMNLRYERIDEAGKIERVDRIWVRRVWSQDQFSSALEAARFSVTDVRTLEFGVTQICARAAT